MHETTHASDSFDAVLSDLDNTLFDRDQAFLAWAGAFVRTRLARLDDVRQREALALLVALDAHGYGSKEAMFARLKETYPELDGSVEDLVETFRAELRGYGALDAGTLRLLDVLDEAHIQFGIVTNGTRHQMHKIRALGLDTRTACVFVSEIYGCRKPEPGIFLAAAARLSVHPARVLFVGDNPEADIWGAHQAGMRTAWLPRGQTWPPHLPDSCIGWRIDTLEDVIGLLTSRSIAPQRLAPDEEVNTCG